MAATITMEAMYEDAGVINLDHVAYGEIRCKLSDGNLGGAAIEYSYNEKFEPCETLQAGQSLEYQWLGTPYNQAIHYRKKAGEVNNVHLVIELVKATY